MSRAHDPAPIELADSVTALDARHAGSVVVTGSHGGLIAAWYVARARVRAAIFNDAGRGLDDAGIGGLAALDAAGLAAAAVAHTSARIGDAGDACANGTIASVNAAAARCGVTRGMPCAVAAERLRHAPLPTGTVERAAEARVCLFAADAGRPAAWAIDSIGQVVAADAGALLVIGSHGALHGGDPASALPVAAAAAFFHDAGRGKDDAGTTRLPVLARRGIPAATVDYRTARIGDARSLAATGVLSCVNEPLARRGIRPGMPLGEVLARWRA